MVDTVHLDGFFYIYFTDCADFVTGCPENRRFRGKQLTVRPLEVTKQVAVEVLPNMTEDHLCLYFENEGVNVEKVKINEGELPAVITLEDHRGKTVVTEVKYKCLGVSVY